MNQKIFSFASAFFLSISPLVAINTDGDSVDGTRTRTIASSVEALQEKWNKTCAAEADLKNLKGKSARKPQVQAQLKGLEKRFQDLIQEGVKQGFVPARLRRARNTLQSITEEMEELRAEIEAKKDKLTNGAEQTPLTETRALYGRLFALQEHEWDFSREVNDLEEAAEAGEIILHDVAYYQDNGISLSKLRGSYTPRAAPDKDVLHAKALAELQCAQRALDLTQKDLAALYAQVKTPDARNFVQGIQNFIEKSAYPSILAYWTRFLEKKELSPLEREDKTHVYYADHPDYLPHAIAKEFGLEKAIFQAVESYTQLPYTLQASFEDIQKVRDGLLGVLNRYSDYPEAMSNALYAFANFFIKAQETKIDLGAEALKAHTIALKEAERYLDALNDPSDFARLTSPVFYARYKEAPLDERDIAFRTHHGSASDVESGALVEVFTHQVKGRLGLYMTEFMNRDYTPYRRAFFQEAGALHKVLDFMSFATAVRQALLGARIGDVEARIAAFGPFYQDAQPAQNIFTHKAHPYTVRVKKDGSNRFTLGLLENHTYTSAGKLVRMKEGGLLIDYHPNELAKLSFEGRVSSLIPSGYKEHPTGWRAPQALRDHLLDQAHFDLN